MKKTLLAFSTVMRRDSSLLRASLLNFVASLMTCAGTRWNEERPRSHLTDYPSHLTRLWSHLTRYWSHLTRYLSHAFEFTFLRTDQVHHTAHTPQHRTALLHSVSSTLAMFSVVRSDLGLHCPPCSPLPILSDQHVYRWPAAL